MFSNPSTLWQAWPNFVRMLSEIVGNLRWQCSSREYLKFLCGSHWKVKAPAELFGLRQAPAALRRKTGLGSPVA